MENLKLCYSPTCMYSQKVLRFIQENGIEIELSSTHEPQNRQYLIAEGGMNQVPCLFIDGEAMYESDDIIAYLQQRFC